MMTHAKIFTLPLAACALFLSASLSAELASDRDKEALEVSDIDLLDATADAFFGDGWYGDLSLVGNGICETNPTFFFCLTALDAPVLEVPAWGGWGGGGGGHHRHKRRHHRPDPTPTPQ